MSLLQRIFKQKPLSIILTTTLLFIPSTRALSTTPGDISTRNNLNRMSSNRPKSSSNNNNPKIEKPRIPVLQYHDEWVVVNKPAGLTVHRTKGMSNRQSVLSALLKRQLARKVFPVHRLDHRTSGAILFAFNSKKCGELHGALRNPDGTKQYIALLRGDWDDKYNRDEAITVNKPLTVKGVSKESITVFTRLASIRGSEDQRTLFNANNNSTSSSVDDTQPFMPACTLVRVEPKTGRTHQIRRHAASIGYPILGDTEHGDSKVNRWWRKNRDLNRLALHCFALDLPLSSDSDIDTEDECTEQTRVQTVAPLSPELTAVLQSEKLKPLWEEALTQEPRLTLDPIDFRGGTFGRRQKAEVIPDNNHQSNE